MKRRLGDVLRILRKRSVWLQARIAIGEDVGNNRSLDKEEMEALQQAIEVLEGQQSEQVQKLSNLLAERDAHVASLERKLEKRKRHIEAIEKDKASLWKQLQGAGIEPCLIAGKVRRDDMRRAE